MLWQQASRTTQVGQKIVLIFQEWFRGKKLFVDVWTVITTWNLTGPFFGPRRLKMFPAGAQHTCFVTDAILKTSFVISQWRLDQPWQQEKSWSGPLWHIHWCFSFFTNYFLACVALLMIKLLLFCSAQQCSLGSTSFFSSTALSCRIICVFSRCGWLRLLFTFLSVVCGGVLSSIFQCWLHFDLISKRCKYQNNKMMLDIIANQKTFRCSETSSE